MSKSNGSSENGVDRRDEKIRAWASHAQVPVINMESALWHPLQGLADLMTMRGAHGDLRGRELAIVWTPSPDPQGPAVVNTVLHAAVREGMRVRVAHPAGFELDRVGKLDQRELVRVPEPRLTAAAA